MKQLTKEDRVHIQNLTEKFIANTLGDVLPAGMCFVVCYPLHIHLTNNGIPNSIRAGYVPKLDTRELTEHYWLNLEDQEDTILDPTIQQFKGDLPPAFTEEKIFICKKPKEFLETPNYINLKFDETYQIWKGLFDKEFELGVTSSVNFKAAEILRAETEQLSLKRDSTQSGIIKKYFDYITMLAAAEYVQDCLLQFEDEFGTGKPKCDFDGRYIKLKYNTDRSKEMNLSIRTSVGLKRRLYIGSLVLVSSYTNYDSLDLEYCVKDFQLM